MNPNTKPYQMQSKAYKKLIIAMIVIRP